MKEENKPPTASFNFTPFTPKTNQTIKFNSNSTDPDGSIDIYNWSFGDDSSSTSAKPSHTYTEAGTYEVELTVIDDDGETDSTIKEVTVEDSKTTAKFTYSPKQPKAGEQVTFDATSSTDEDGTIESYEWDLTGDGNIEEFGPKTTYNYEREGTYKVTLTVTDTYGATSSTTKQIKATKPNVEGKLKGEVKYVKGTGKGEADKGEYAVINLGEEDGVKAGDNFKVFLTAKDGGIFEKVHTRIEITKVAGPHLAVGRIMESGLTVEKGFKVRKVEND